MTIEEVLESSPELVEAIARLLPQVSSSPPPGPDEVAEIVGSPATHLLVARDEDGSIIGTLTLAIFRLPSGLRAWIEDVVVDEPARGRRPSVGGELNRHALALARDLGARTVELTSRPSREAANEMYQRLGFTRRETNVYRYLVQDLGPL